MFENVIKVRTKINIDFSLCHSTARTILENRAEIDHSDIQITRFKPQLYDDLATCLNHLGEHELAIQNSTMVQKLIISQRHGGVFF